MARLRVIRGTCGISCVNQNGTVRYEAKTAKSGPFEYDDKKAARLVALGVAAYVGSKEGQNRLPDQPEKEPEISEGRPNEEEDSEKESPEELYLMTKKQLEAKAKELGINVSGFTKKGDYVEAICQAQDVMDDGEEEPSLEAEEPI